MSSGWQTAAAIGATFSAIAAAYVVLGRVSIAWNRWQKARADKAMWAFMEDDVARHVYVSWDHCCDCYFTWEEVSNGREAGTT